MNPNNAEILVRKFCFLDRKLSVLLALGGGLESLLELWPDPMRIEVPARTTGEPRWPLIGRMDGRHWSAIVTYRHHSYFSPGHVSRPAAGLGAAAGER